MPYSAQLEKVLGEPGGILDGVSGGKMALRIARTGGDLSAATALRIKKGQYGEAQSLRQIGAAFAAELLERHGEEIQQLMGEANEEAAAEWLVYIADPELSRIRPAGAEAVPAPALEEIVSRVAEEAVRRTLEEQRQQQEPGTLARELLTRLEDVPDSELADIEDLEDVDIRGYHGDNIPEKHRRILEKALRYVIHLNRKREGRE